MSVETFTSAERSPVTQAQHQPCRGLVLPENLDRPRHTLTLSKVRDFSHGKTSAHRMSSSMPQPVVHRTAQPSIIRLPQTYGRRLTRRSWDGTEARPMECAWMLAATPTPLRTPVRSVALDSQRME